MTIPRKFYRIDESEMLKYHKRTYWNFKIIEQRMNKSYKLIFFMKFEFIYFLKGFLFHIGKGV